MFKCLPELVRQQRMHARGVHLGREDRRDAIRNIEDRIAHAARRPEGRFRHVIEVAKVRWAERNRFGLEFLKMPQDDKERLLGLVRDFYA